MLQQMWPGGTRHQAEESYRFALSVGMPDIALQKLNFEVRMGSAVHYKILSTQDRERSIENFGLYVPFESSVQSCAVATRTPVSKHQCL
jgi:hypothetical protein